MDGIADLARRRFGLPHLRPGQREGIEALVAGRDALVLMPTGGGKSAVYEIAGAVRGGLTVVISPLVALQRDQVDGIADKPDAPRAVLVNATLRADERRAAWDAIADGTAGYAFLTPEQLARDDVQARLRDRGVSLLAVDEAHCVSEWGHDFRPDYLRIAAARAALGAPPTVATTATASPPVRDEIVERLELREPLVLSSGFDRPNIRLEVVRHEDPHEKRAHILADVAGLPGSGLVYTATRHGAEDYAAALVASGRRAAAYHAGLASGVRTDVHEAFRSGAVDVVVATSAFGMGIDKPDVRFVVHVDPPESVDSYYQEIGRGGRDGAPAVARLHFRPEDLAVAAFHAGRRADEEVVMALVAAVADGSARPTAELEAATGIPHRRLARTLAELLERGVLREEGADVRLTAPIAAADAVGLLARHAVSEEHVQRSRLAMMRGYAEARGCRRHHLLGYFGEEFAGPCGNCDADEAVPIADAGGTWAPGLAVEHPVFGRGLVIEAEADRITVFFERDGYKVVSRAAAEEHRLLQAVAE